MSEAENKAWLDLKAKMATEADIHEKRLRLIEAQLDRLLEARRTDTIWHRIDAWMENAPTSKLAFYSAIVGIGLVVAGATVMTLLLRWHP